MISARLIGRGWLRRKIEVSLLDGTHLLEYYGAGLGYEQVSADGLVIRKTSLIWFVPRFEFKLGGWPAVLEVRVWPWFTVRSLVLRVGDRVVYAEGEVPADQKPKLSSEWAELE
jgi:hypothetical protein